MAKPTCPKCGDTKFKVDEVNPYRGSAEYPIFELCYCEACGHIVGGGFSNIQVISIREAVKVEQ